MQKQYIKDALSQSKTALGPRLDLGISVEITLTGLQAIPRL